MKKNKILEYMITPMITIGILLFIFLIKQIYPFGNNTICTVDMPVGYVPAYTQLWDILHNEGNIFYNFNLGAGSNIYGAIISNGFLSPINWIVGLFSRENIAGAMSVLIIIKMSLMALTSYIFFDKVFNKIDKIWKIISSLMYVFNGYTLLMYSNIIWFDSLALFPLITLAFKKLLDSGKCFWYITLLAINLMISFYISWLLLMIVVFGGAVAVFTYIQKDRRKEIGTKILISTIVALLISFVSFLPAFMQSTNSYRLGDGMDSTASVGNFLWFKLFHIILSGTLIYFNFAYFMNYKKDKKGIKLYGGLLFLTILPIFVDSINKMWHTGSYSNFPYRYGFITIFIMICVMLHYLQNVKKEDRKNDKNKQLLIISGISFIALIVISVIIYFIYGDLTKGFGLNQIEKQLYVLIMWFTGIELFIVYCVTNLNSEKLKKNIILVLVLFQIIVDSFIFIENLYINKLNTDEEINNFNFYRISKGLEFDKYKSLYKFKDETRLLTMNYPYISKVPAMTTWLHIISTEQRLSAEKLGYSTYKTLILDQGGTLASDIILANKYTLSKEDFDKTVYTQVGQTDDVKLYELNMKNNFTKIYNKNKDISTIMNSEDNLFDIQNNIIKNLFSTEENIIEIEQNKNIDKNIVNFNLKVKGKINLYLDVDKYTEDSYVKEIYINNNKKGILTSFGQVIENYPDTMYVNGILNLGIFDDTDVNIKLVLSDEVTDETVNSISIGKLDINKLQELVNKDKFDENININENSFSVNVNSDSQENALFIPITYNNGWSCKINGKSVTINRALDSFMSVDLQEGDNDIQFVFVPSYFDIALKITIITIIVFILFEVLSRFLKDNVKEKLKIFYNLGYVLYLIVVLIFLYKIYLVSIVNSIKSIF